MLFTQGRGRSSVTDLQRSGYVIKFTYLLVCLGTGEASRGVGLIYIFKSVGFTACTAVRLSVFIFLGMGYCGHRN